ncbi:hypothetical protein IIA29_11515 [candidate division KSB1 bacterium]|nr:hypothetical protein [candidate division KSB1 bacterium]
MSADFYKIAHITGVLILFLSMGGAVVRGMTSDTSASVRKMIGITNGVGLLIAIVAGFGMMAKLGIGFDGWIIGKLLIWLAFGGLLAMANRKPEMATQLLFIVIILGTVAAYLAVMKPF